MSSSNVLPSHSEILQSVFGGTPLQNLDDDGDDHLTENQPHIEEEEPVFRCTLDSVETLWSLLNAILIDRRDNTAAHWTVTQQGVKIAIQKHHVLQAKVYIKAESFQEFVLNTRTKSNHQRQVLEQESDESLNFAVNLAVLVDCLSVFGDAELSRSVHLDIAMISPDEPLCLMLEDQGVITNCEIMTIDAPPPGDFSFRSHPVVNRVTLKASVLKDMFQDLDLKGGNAVEFTISPQFPNFAFKVTGDACTFEISLPRESSLDAFSVFDSPETQTFLYNMNTFKSCHKAIARAEQVNIRKNEIGMLSMQFVIRPHNSPSSQNWIDFLICPEAQEEGNSQTQTQAKV